MPPSYRRDLREDVDLIEEIARLFGYDRIPPTLPSLERRSLGQLPPENSSRRLVSQIKSLLTSQGFSEVVTYSLLSQTLQKQFSRQGAITIQNPLSLEQERMRISLLPRLVEVAARNFNHKAEGVVIFELGPVYEMDGTGNPRERQSLGVLLAGKTPSDWKIKSRPYDFFDVKGKCGLICETLGIPAIQTSSSLPFLAEAGATALHLESGEEVGYFGELTSFIRQAMDIPVPVYVAELDFSLLTEITRPSVRYEAVSKYPSVTRDISLIIREGITSQTLEETIQKAAGSLLHNVFLFDEYLDPDHKVVPKGSRSLAYRMEFLHPERTLTQQEVDGAVHSVQQSLKALGAQVRA